MFYIYNLGASFKVHSQYLTNFIDYVILYLIITRRGHDGLLLFNIIQRVLCFEIIVDTSQRGLSMSLSNIPDHPLLFPLYFNDASLWQRIILLQLPHLFLFQAQFLLFLINSF